MIKEKRGRWIIIKPEKPRIITYIEDLQDYVRASCGLYAGRKKCRLRCPSDRDNLCCAFCPKLSTCAHLCTRVKKFLEGEVE